MCYNKNFFLHFSFSPLMEIHSLRLVHTDFVKCSRIGQFFCMRKTWSVRKFSILLRKRMRFTQVWTSLYVTQFFWLDSPLLHNLPVLVCPHSRFPFYSILKILTRNGSINYKVLFWHHQKLCTDIWEKFDKTYFWALGTWKLRYSDSILQNLV